jgi:hypothetical protein
MRIFISAGFLALLSTSVAQAQQNACPAMDSSGLIVFSNGSIAMSTASIAPAGKGPSLKINPDGAPTAYTPGDSGHVYVANGVNLIENGRKFPCAPRNQSILKLHQAKCRDLWLKAEAAEFKPGTSAFCSFAIQVDPFSEGQSRTKCELDENGNSSRYVIGNGKGKPRLGPPVPNAVGGMSNSYVSTTAIEHTVNGQRVPLNSNRIPALVTPTSRSELKGAVAWVTYRNVSTFAIMGDTGPRWGEASVALHEYLRYGSIGSEHIVGPIPLSARCNSAERNLRAPFVSRPDSKSPDQCGQTGARTSKSDIRARTNIEGNVQMVILPGVKLPMTGRSVVNIEVTTTALEAAAAQAGFTREKLTSMANCTRQARRP